MIMKIKDYVYGYDNYGNLQEGKIKQFLDSNGVEYVKFGIGFTLPKSMVFLSKKDCINCYNKNFNDKVVSYCKSISTIEDLVIFMFNHCVSCADRTKKLVERFLEEIKMELDKNEHSAL